MTPVKAIRAKCMDCCYGQANEVRLCPCTDCSLWPFRLGHNPNIVRKRTASSLTPENTSLSMVSEHGTSGEGKYTSEDCKSEKGSQANDFWKRM